MNRWSEPDDRLTTVEALQACLVLDGPQPPRRGVSYVVGLDVGVVHDATAAVVAHAEPIEREGVATGVRVVIDRVQTWRGTRSKPVQLAEVGDYIRETSREYNLARVVFDPHQAIELTQRLDRAGVPVEKFDFTAASVGRLALALHQALRNQTLALPRDPELVDELAHVRLKSTSHGTVRLDHDADKHDDMAVAVALCVHRLTERGVRRPARWLVPTGRIPTPSRDPLARIAAATGVPVFDGRAAAVAEFGIDNTRGKR